MLLCYEVKAKKHVLAHKYSDYKIQFIDTPATYSPKNYKNQHILCLIDDFIGSGQTAVDAYAYIHELSGICKDSVAILSLVAMQEGIDRLFNEKYTIHSAITRCKGISGTVDSDQKYAIMKIIEDRIHVSDDYRLGYMQSESLVKMIRTPNNTFPVYWMVGKNTNPNAPFPR